jgi:hypothetical protein
VGIDNYQLSSPEIKVVHRQIPVSPASRGKKWHSLPSHRLEAADQAVTALSKKQKPSCGREVGWTVQHPAESAHLIIPAQRAGPLYLLQTHNIASLNQVRNAIQIFSTVRPPGTVHVVGRNTE